MLIIAMFITYKIAQSICTETEVKPVRYEYGGLFGNIKILVPTTEGNEDAYDRVCIKTGEPNFFSISENLEFIIRQMEKNEMEKNEI